MSPKELADNAQAQSFLYNAGYAYEECQACRGTGMNACALRIARIAKDGSDDGLYEQRSHCSFCAGTGHFWFWSGARKFTPQTTVDPGYPT